MIVITGASGQLGRLVIQSLLTKVPAGSIVAAVRNPEKASDLAALGVQIRRADYTDSASLDAAFQGAEKVLLISSSEVGQRLAQHRNAIDAAKRAGVSLLAYTSLLHADTSPLGLAGEHVGDRSLSCTSRRPVRAVAQRLVYGELSGQHTARAATRRLHRQRRGRTHCLRRACRLRRGRRRRPDNARPIRQGV